MFTSSIASYPDRGPFGDNKYRGNCSGHIVADLIDNYLPAGGLIVDPAVGGGTSQEVAASKGVRFFGTDLHSGFNLLVDDLCSTVGEKANLVFFHPPYGSMIQYSGHMWGNEHKHDMSRLSDDDFRAALKLALHNISDATLAGGHYAVLMGNHRRKGVYINWSSITEALAPDPLVDEIIKIQHNVVSNSSTYKQSRTPLVRIMHEKLLLFRKDPKINAVSSFEQYVSMIESDLAQELLATLRRVMQCSSWSEHEILSLISNVYTQTSLNIDWPGLVRKLLLSHHFVNDNGRFRLS
ncbi:MULTISPECIES: DNA adenine modification methylase [Shewanella]|uniref:DNA adenine modification methylase n=1 Tax=Shewanella TaxID=22 RepID=UPI00217A2491|nr:DNA adenine modification methylase [Shewanella xiamenensis]MCT8869285.1 DNA adenine modification methylase [Shewanella xiamenensis]MCT8873872.1 DNA adenine modification methylase [Shewanella xiamenensis]MCT8877538.1 DNA adenine modification methylase [Shewanella xiamenensis]UWH39972.1 DNA adenine modification methylase [Shewanella xiamenensis]BDQ68454.1 hypothetical protein NUITMVS2_42670 [Shewanella xiamenensis]